MILRSQRNFTIVRQLADHTDTSTYYVRCVIRDSFTDEILATLDLDSKGNQRFSKTWLVAPDISGQGRDISIVTSVYTDSAYTTKSSNYGDEENTHIIENANFTGGGVSMGGGKLDSATIRRIFVEEFKKIKEKDTKEPEDKTEAPEPEDTQVIDKLNEVLTAVQSIKMPEVPQPEKVDLQPIINGLSTIYNAVLDKEVTPPTDLSEVKSAVNDLKTSNLEMVDRIITIVEGIDNTVQTVIKSMFSKISFVIPQNNILVKSKDEEVIEDEKAPEIDINLLTQ